MGFPLDQVHLPSWTNSWFSYSSCSSRDSCISHNPGKRVSSPKPLIFHLYSFFLSEGNQYNSYLIIASLHGLCISLFWAKSTKPAANPPRGKLYPTAMWQEQSDLEQAPATNVTVRWIRTVSQDKISGKQAGEQWGYGPPPAHIRRQLTDLGLLGKGNRCFSLHRLCLPIFYPLPFLMKHSLPSTQGTRPPMNTHALKRVFILMHYHLCLLFQQIKAKML